MEYIEKTLTGIITHGTTSITFTDDFITNDSIIDVYFSSDDIVPTNQEQIGNRLIISIESQTIDISVAVHITNDDTINYTDELESLSDTVENHTSVLSSHGSEIINLRHDVDNIENDMQEFDTRLDDCFISVSNGKELIADAITDKGVATSATDTFQTMALNISEIESGGGGAIELPWRRITGFMGGSATALQYYTSASASMYVIDMRSVKNKTGVLTIRTPAFTSRTRNGMGADYTPITNKNYTMIDFLDSGTNNYNKLFTPTNDYFYFYGYSSGYTTYNLTTCKFTEVI